MYFHIRYSSRQKIGFIIGTGSFGFADPDPGQRPYGRAITWPQEGEPNDVRTFNSRESAAAWVLRHLDARIVDTADELSTTEPTCLIEEI